MDVNQNDLKYNRRMTRAVIRRSCSVGFFMLFSSICSLLFSNLYFTYFHGNIGEISKVFSEILTQTYNISSTWAVVVANNVLLSGAIDTLFSMFSMLFSLFLPAFLLGKMWSKSVVDCFVTKGKIVKGAVFIYAFCQFVVMCTTAVADVMWGFLFPQSYTVAGTEAIIYENNDVFSLLISIICTCIFVPVLEEYVFRGVIFKIFCDVGTGFAIVASALSFGLMHNDIRQCMYAVMFGLFSAMLVCATGNMKTSVLFHMLNNLITLSNSFLPQCFGEKVHKVVDIVYMLYVLCFSFYGMYLFLSKGGVLHSVRKSCNNEDTEKTEKATLKRFFTVPVLIFVLLFAVKAVLGAMG